MHIIRLTLRLLLIVAVILLCACSQQVSFPSCIGLSTQDIHFEEGEVTLGEVGIYPEELGTKTVKIEAFSMSATEVTNFEFAQFVDATGYLTRAERGLDQTIAPDLPEQFRQPGAMVFAPFIIKDVNNIRQLWEFVPNANWKHPYGPGSNIDGKEAHPVVQIALEDARAYAKWANRRLPTEAEWEYAARNAGSSKPIGEITPPNNANIWDGEFPFENTLKDGYQGTSPVGCFEPTQRGLYDMLGNVWELTDSVYYPSHIQNSVHKTSQDINSHDSDNIPMSVIKGGSHLCASNFCARYRPESRQPQDDFLATSHVGFRTVAIN